MNVLLTGGTGYIGSHTAIALAKSGHRVVLYDNLCNSVANVADRITTIVGDLIPLVIADVRDTAFLTDTMKAYDIDVVIHFAGLKSVGESNAAPVNYYAANVQGTISLLQAMQALEIKSLIFSSSATVYGSPQFVPIDEEHPTSATNPYGRSKLHIEEMLRDLATSDESWRIACLRYFNPVGAHESGLIGEEPNGIPNNLVPYVARVASGCLPQLSVFGGDYATPDGTGVRDYIHVMDLGEGHVAALSYLSRAHGWHAINLGTGRGHSVLEVVKAFEAQCGVAVPYRIVPRRSGDVASCFGQVDKAATVLDWSAKRNLNDMCTSAWRSHINRPKQID